MSILDQMPAFKSRLFNSAPKQEKEWLQQKLVECRELSQKLQECFNDSLLSMPQDYKVNCESSEGQPRYKIVCPYCLKDFQVQDLLFRANVVPDYSGNYRNSFEPEEDDRYGDHWEGLTGDRGETVRPHILDMRPENGEISQVTLLDLKGQQHTMAYNNDARRLMQSFKTVNVMDRYGHRSAVRICPECHTELPNDIGFVPNYIFTLLGNTNCGKTVYIRRLILSLCAGNFMGGEYFGQVVNDESVGLEDSFIQGARRTFEAGVPLSEATQMVYLRPVIIRLINTHTRSEIYITLFDYPGEAMWHPEDQYFQDIAARNLNNSNGWIVVFDSGSLEDVHRSLEPEYQQIPDFDVAALEQRADPNQIIDQITKVYAYGQAISKPVSFVLSKSDLIGKCQNQFLGVGLNPNATFLRQPSVHQRVDLDDLYTCDLEIRRFLQSLQPAVNVAQADYFTQRNNAWFAVSSTYVSPENGVIPERMRARGLRDTCALEWLLYRCGQLPGESRSSNLDVAEWAYTFQHGAPGYRDLMKQRAEAYQDVQDLENALRQRG